MYFQINYIAEPFTKLCTKSYGHVFCYCFLNKQMESYNLKLNNMILFATICVSFLIFTLSCEENLLFRSRRQNFAKVKNSPDNIIPLISFFFSVLYAIFNLNSNKAIFSEKSTTQGSSQTQEMYFFKVHATTTTKYKRFFKLYPFFSIILLIKNLVFINVLFSYSIYLHKQKFSSYKIFR